MRARDAAVVLRDRRRDAAAVPPGDGFDVAQYGVDALETDAATRLLCEQYHTRDLQGFGIAAAGLAISAAGCLLQYVKDTLKTTVTHLQPPRLEQVSDLLLIDANSRRNLELTRSFNDESSQHSLLGIIGHCRTAMGHRELTRWIQKPAINSGCAGATTRSPACSITTNS